MILWYYLYHFVILCVFTIRNIEQKTSPIDTGKNSAAERFRKPLLSPEHKCGQMDIFITIAQVPVFEMDVFRFESIHKVAIEVDSGEQIEKIRTSAFVL
ncbi:6883_t:CDS:2 [Funneliformis mosseae]|uniref:6883_t:CDS:1 n=1 Tax=Funneliformis mosseae TaxID=27381 RepID=A0A9N9BMC5_FUNMO|nr:6883_t:CDS:2 [Funneliformis mosseae]